MTQEEKNFYLKIDLCARLPYGVKVSYLGDSNHVYNLELIDITDNEVYISTYEPCYSNKYTDIESIRPYLYPLSSMTEEQKLEEYKLMNSNFYTSTVELPDFYNKNHIDYVGLIPMGLANDATGLNIYG